MNSTALKVKASTLAGGSVDGLVELGAQEQPGTVMTGAFGGLGQPVLVEFLEQTRTQRQDALLGAFTLAHAQLHARTVDIGGLQMSRFGERQAGGLDGHEESPVARLARSGEEGLQFAPGAGQIGHAGRVGLLGAFGPATNGQTPNVFFSQWSHRPATWLAMISLAAPNQLRVAASFNPALQRTRLVRSCCNPASSWAGSLNWSRYVWTSRASAASLAGCLGKYES